MYNYVQLFYLHDYFMIKLQLGLGFVYSSLFVLISGTYGNRQVLSIQTNGPYTHIFDF